MLDISDMEIVIDNKTYVLRDRRKVPHSVGYLASVMIMMGAGLNMIGPKSKERPAVNLIDEYKLILEKKSQLSRSEREYVVSQFNITFKEKKQ